MVNNGSAEQEFAKSAMSNNKDFFNIGFLRTSSPSVMYSHNQPPSSILFEKYIRA
jgi:hypothetical protein